MNNLSSLTHELLTPPVKVGLVGTGYAAKRRAEALQRDQRGQLMFVAGHTRENTTIFSQTYQVTALESWQELVNHPQLDLVIICTINCDHGRITEAALLAGKQVVIEYPLALNYLEGQKLLDLAQKQHKLLHIEHIEILGGLHQAIVKYLPAVGSVFYSRYITLSGQKPAKGRWNYHQQQFGFPLTAALSRIHRITDLFGTVDSVTCDLRYWNAADAGYFRAFLCNAQLKLTNGILAHITYGKGEIFAKSERTFEIHGEQGSLIFRGDQGQLIKQGNIIPIDVGSRRGLFAKDTHMVLDALIEGTPLYITPAQSCYALKIANAADESVQTGQTVKLNSSSSI
jgi:biliverdin reductase